MRKRTTIDLDQDLVREAAAVLGTTRTTDTIHAALSSFAAVEGWGCSRFRLTSK
jgi:Arc/MetJ family transcription regulator